MDRLVSVRLAKLERALKELEERAGYLASRADETEGVVENIEANVLGRLGTIEAWAQSTDEALSLIVEAERRPSADGNKILRDLRAVADSIELMLRRELSRE